MQDGIRRTPIYLAPRTVAVIHIFEKKMDLFEDVWMDNFFQHVEEEYMCHDQAAKQFISQLKDHWCIAFMEALILEAFEEIHKDGQRCDIKRTKIMLERLAGKYGYDLVKREGFFSEDDKFKEFLLDNGFEQRLSYFKKDDYRVTNSYSSTFNPSYWFISNSKEQIFKGLPGETKQYVIDNILKKDENGGN